MAIRTYVPSMDLKKIKAVQWRGNNLDELKEFIGDKLFIDDNFLPMDYGYPMVDLYLKDFHNKIKINVFDYVAILYHRNTYTIIDPLTFELMYERRR